MTPSLGIIIGLPIAGLITLACLIAAAVFFSAGRRTDYDPTELYLGAAGCVVGALIVAGITGVAMWPWAGEYHSWRTTSGTVARIDSRLISAGENAGMNQRFVVTFTDNRQRACDDTRCSTVKIGDRLTLKCKRAYQWGSTPGYDCNWVGNQRPR